MEKLCFGCFKPHDGIGPCPHCGFDLSTVKHPYIALPIGTILNGRYLTGRVLGVGGFGVTYLAWDLTLEICVAVKEYLPSGIAIRDADHYTMTVSSQEEQAQYDNGSNKFLDEARILAKLRAVPNIITVHDYFRENNTAYFVMEYIEGVDLMKYAQTKGGKLSFDEAVTLLLPIIDSLAYVHEHNLLHRDISPDNIFVTRNGSTRLLDFGAARLAVDSGKSKSIILKHGFAPEEQYRKHGNQGPWTDEYALAATMYLILTGVMPPDAIERVHEDTLVPPKDLGVDMPDYANDALVKALAVKASGRFPDMKSFSRALTGKDRAVSPSAVSSAVASSSSAASSQAASSPAQVPAQRSPAAPVASAGTSASSGMTPAAPSPLKPVAVTPAVSPAVSKEKEAVSAPKTKKSIWKRPITYVVAGIILAAGIATPIGIYFAGKNSSEETKATTKKKTTRATTTTEAPETSPTTTETTTAAPTTTQTVVPTTTEAPEPTGSAVPVAVAPIDLGDRSLYSLTDLNYTVTNNWSCQESEGYLYFFPEWGNTNNFLTVLAMYSMTPDEAKRYDFDRFINEFNSSFLTSANFDNVEITSIDERTDPDIHCADITMTCQHSGKNRDLLLRVLLDQTSGYSYCFMMYLEADGDSDLKAEYTKEYQAIISSLHITTPPELTSSEFREITEKDGFILEEEQDEDALENWSAYQVNASNGSIVLISYYLFDTEEKAKSCYDESYKELLGNQSDGSFSGYLVGGTWRFISEGTYYENSAIGEGEYRVAGILSGKTVYIIISSKDDDSMSLLTRGTYDLGF